MSYDVTIPAAKYLSELFAGSLEKCVIENKLMETPADVAKAERERESIRKAEELLKHDILNKESISEYYYLEEEIKSKSELISKLYGIEAAPGYYRALCVAREEYEDQYRQAVSEEAANFSSEQEKILSDYDARINEANESANEEVLRLENEIQTMQTEAHRELEREAAEYDYNLARTRKSAKDKRAAFVADREGELHSRELAAEQEKEECIELIARIDKMQDEVDSIPELLEQAKRKGAEEEQQILEKSFAYARELDEADQKHKIQGIQTEYNSLKEKYDLLCEEIQDINTRLEQCNAESRKLTSDTVRSIGGINILNSERTLKNDN